MTRAALTTQTAPADTDHRYRDPPRQPSGNGSRVRDRPQDLTDPLLQPLHALPGERADVEQPARRPATLPTPWVELQVPAGV